MTTINPDYLAAVIARLRRCGVYGGDEHPDDVYPPETPDTPFDAPEFEEDVYFVARVFLGNPIPGYEWTSTPPTVTGWYWWRRMPECKPATYHVLFEAGKWWILEGGFGTDGDYIPLDDIQGGEWAGPIQPPA